MVYDYLLAWYDLIGMGASCGYLNIQMIYLNENHF